MDIAVKMLEDRAWIRNYLSRSIATLARQRLLAESLLNQAGIKYYARGYAALLLTFLANPQQKRWSLPLA
jgi:1-aminocyclopropane-1-carboxylate synthase